MSISFAATPQAKEAQQARTYTDPSRGAPPSRRSGANAPYIDKDHWNKVFTEPEYFDSIAKQKGMAEGAKVSLFGDDYVYRQAMIGYMSATRNVPLDDMRKVFDVEKDGFAKKVLGKQTASARELFDWHKSKFERDNEKQAAARQILNNVAQRAITDFATGGDTAFVESVAKDIDAAGDMFSDEEKSMLWEKAEENDMKLRATQMRFAPEAKFIFDALRQTTGEGAGFGAPDMRDMATRFAKLPDKQRRAVYELAGSFAQLNQTDKGFWYQMAESLGRGASDIVERVPRNVKEQALRNDLRMLEGDQPVFAGTGVQGTAYSAFGTTPLTPEEREQAADKVRGELGVFKVERELRDLAERVIDPIKTVTVLPEIVEEGLYGAARSLPYTAVAAVPYAGAPAVAGALYSSNYDRIMLEYPDIDPDKAALIAAISAPIEAGLERMKVNTIMGRLPFFGGLVKRFQHPNQRNITRIAIGGAGVLAEQNAQEILQNATFPFVQMIGSVLDKDIPEYNLDLASMPRDLAVQFVALLPLSLMGIGALSHREISRGESYLRNKDNLEKAGYSEEQIDRITGAATADEAQSILREESKKRDPEKVKAAAQRIVDESIALREKANPAALPRLERQGADYVVLSPEGKELARSTDQTAAEQALVSARRETVQREMRGVTNGINLALEFINKANEARSRGEDIQKFILENRNNDLFQDYEANPTEQNLERLFETVTAFGFDAKEPEDLKNFPVLASNQGALRDGIYRSIVRIFDGADGTIVMRDFAQDNLKRAMAEGRVSIDWVRSKLNELIPQIDSDRIERKLRTETDTDVIEAFSDVAIAYFRGRITEDMIPEGFRGFFRRMAVLMADIFRRSYRLARLRAEGKLDRDFEALLAEAVGVNQQALVDRARERTEQEVGAGQNYSIGMAPQPKPQLDWQFKRNGPDRWQEATYEFNDPSLPIDKITFSIEYAGQRTGGYYIRWTALKDGKRVDVDFKEINQPKSSEGYRYPAARTPVVAKELVANAISGLLSGQQYDLATLSTVRAASAFDALQLIAATTGEYSQLAQAILNAAKTNSEIMGSLTVTTFRRKRDSQNKGRLKNRSFYSPSWRSIYMMDKDAGDARVVMHEVIHGILVQKLPVDLATQGVKGAKYKKALDDALKSATTPAPLKDIIRGYILTAEAMGATESLWGEGPLRGTFSQTIYKSAKYLGVVGRNATSKAQREGGRMFEVEGMTTVKRVLQYLKENGITEVDVIRRGAKQYDVIVAQSDLNKIETPKEKRQKFGARGYDPDQGFLSWIVRERKPPIANRPDTVVEYGFEYGLGNLDEFLAEAFSSPKFQGILNGIQMEDGRTVWQAIIDAIRRILGMSVKQGSVLDVISRSAIELAGTPDVLLVGGAPISDVTSPQNYSIAITPQQDSDYLAAVERGDMEMAQRMVDEAAKAAGYFSDTVFHGTPNKGFDAFDANMQGRVDDGYLGRAFYFDSKESTSWIYAQTPNDSIPKAKKKGAWKEAFGANRYGSVGRFVLSGKLLELNEQQIGNRERDRVDVAKEALGLPINATGSDITAEAQRQGFDGIVYRSRFGNEYAVFSASQIKSADPVTYDASGNVIPLSQRFDSTTANINYSISTQSEIDRVQAAMDRLARSPSERIAQYAALKERLAAALERNQPIMQSMRGDTLPQDFDRTRILNDLGFLDYILKVLPPEVRGRVGGYTNLAAIAPVDVYKGDQKVSEAKNPAGAIISAWMREGLNIGQAQKKTELPEGYSTVANTTDERRDKTIANFLIDRLKKIDRELERYYKRDLMERIFDVLDKSRPKAGQSGVKRSTLGAETQKFADMVYRASLLDDEKTPKRLAAIEAEITSIQPKDNSPEAVAESQKLISQLSEEWTIVNTFGDLKSRSSETLASGLEWLRGQLKAGREAWQIKEAARIQENRERAAKVVAFLGKPTDVGRFKNKSTLQRFLQNINAFDLDHKSFEQLAFWLFGDEVSAELSKKMMRAQINEAKATLDNMRLILAALREGAKAAGISRGRALALYKENQPNAVRKLEGRKVRPVKISIELAKKIVRGLADRGSLSNADVQTLADELAALPRDTRKENVTIQQVIFRGEEVRLTLSRGQAMQLWLTWQQTDAQEKMRADGFNDDSFEDLDNLISDPFSQAVLRVTQRIYGSGYPLTNPIYARMFGMNMPMVKNYAPARYQSNKDIKDVALDGTALTAGGQPSFAKSRVNHTAKLAPDDALTVLQSHIAQQTQWVAFAEVTREYRSLLANPEVREAIRQRFGEDVLRTADMWGDQMEQRGGNKGREIAWIQNMLGALIGGQSVSLLGYNLKSLAMQTDNFMRFFLALDSRQIAEAMANPAGLFKAIKKVWKTDIIQTRLEGGATAETRFFFERFVSMFRRGARVSELSMMPMNYSDSAGLSVSGAIVYEAAYKDAIDSGMDERSAEQAAKDAVEAMVYRYGQPVLMGQKSNIENSGNAFTKAFFLFMSDPRLKMAIISDSVRGLATGRGDWKAHVRRIVAIEMMAVVAHVLATGFRDLTSDDEDEDLWSMGGFARALLLAPFQGYFLLGSASDLVLSRLTEAQWFTPTQNPLIRTVETGYRALGNLDNAFNFDEPDALVKEWTDITRSIAVAPPLAAPAVIMNIVRPLVQGWERMDDDE
jgi:hypothetical protein